MKKYNKGAILILILINLVNSTYAQDTTSDSISSESITTITKKFGSELDIFDEIQKIYEISDSSLEKGYSVTLNEKDAFRININGRNYYIIVWNITDDDKIHIIFPGKRILVYEVGSIALIDINQDNKLDVQLELKAIVEDYKSGKTVVSIELGGETVTIKDTEYIPNKKVDLFIKKIVEKELVPSGDYFELFDVTVRLAEEEIYTVRELEAYIVFENFGEGPSKIDIVYSIINERGIEVYRGVDSKVVQTEDRVVRSFDFLELSLGKYILRAEIFYGENQTGESEQDFDIVKVPFIDQLGEPLLFISTIIILLLMVVYAKSVYRKRKIPQNKEEIKEK